MPVLTGTKSYLELTRGFDPKALGSRRGKTLPASQLVVSRCCERQTVLVSLLQLSWELSRVAASRCGRIMLLWETLLASPCCCGPRSELRGSLCLAVVGSCSREEQLLLAPSSYEAQWKRGESETMTPSFYLPFILGLVIQHVEMRSSYCLLEITQPS